MKVIIAGSRSIGRMSAIEDAVDLAGFEITEVVSGGARGADKLGEMWAYGQGIPVKRFPADWDKYGSRAGPVRNTEMALYADALIAVWDGYSRGTAHMISTARMMGLPVFVHQITQRPLPERSTTDG